MRFLLGFFAFGEKIFCKIHNPFSIISYQVETLPNNSSMPRDRSRDRGGRHRSRSGSRGRDERRERGNNNNYSKRIDRRERSLSPRRANRDTRSSNHGHGGGYGRSGYQPRNHINRGGRFGRNGRGGSRGGYNGQRGENSSLNNRNAAQKTSVHPPVIKVDREKITPLLLRIFVKEAEHHTVEEFNSDSLPTQDEIQLYTWKDATLKEISNAIKAHKHLARQQHSKLSFSLVYPNKTGANRLRPVAVTQNSKRTKEENLTLKQLKHETGDYLDVAIL